MNAAGAPFERTVHGRWGDMHFNGHVRNTAYLGLAADIRLQCFAALGFSMHEFEPAAGPRHHPRRSAAR